MKNIKGKQTQICHNGLFCFYLGLQNCSFSNIKFWLSFYPTISFQGYSVTFSEYHKTLAKFLWSN